MSRAPGFLDLAVSGDLEKLTDDETLGLLTTQDPDSFPESFVVNVKRLERALIAVRETFNNPSNINLAVVRPADGEDIALALYPVGERDRAVVLAPRHRPDEDIDECTVETQEVI